MPENEPQSVPTTNEKEQLYGHGLLSSEGRGVVNGVPYGEQLEDEKREMTSMYRFRPAAFAALRAQTRKALGR